MATDLRATVPWPPPPDATAGPAARMAWYGAVGRWAPSKHNTQPWRFVARVDALEVWTDVTRMLHETDPRRRELLISCGAAVGTAEVGAHAAGKRLSVSLLPEGGTSFVARLEEVAEHVPSALDLALLEAVPRRRTDRGPLDGEALPATLGFELQSLVASQGLSLHLVRAPGDRATLAALVERADRMLVRRPRVDREIEHWLRETADERGDGVPSDHTRGPAASYRAEFVQRDFSRPGSLPAQDRVGVDRPVIAVLCSPTDKPHEWVRTGRALSALLLRTTLAGGQASYLNQPVEEPAVRAQLQEQLCLTGLPQLVLRLGVGGWVAPTPRREPQDVVLRVDDPGAPT